MSMSDTGVTEFDELNPTSLHLVGAGANGFSPLLAKAAAELSTAIGEEIAEKATDVEPCWETGCQLCDIAAAKAKLKAKERNALPDSDFAIPGERAYPIHDASHARNALARVSEFGTPDEKAKVRAAVHHRYPDIGGDETEAEKAMRRNNGGRFSGTTPDPMAQLGQTHQNHPHAGPVQMANGHEQGDPGGSHYFTAPNDVRRGDGSGDTAPDKTLPTGEAGTQTAAVTRKAGDGGQAADVGVTGDHAGSSDDRPAETEATSQTDEVSRKAATVGVTTATGVAGSPMADTHPGSPAWEDKDAALMASAAQLLEHALAMVREGESREKAEKAIRALQDLLDSNTTGSTTTTKEIDDMTQDELIKLLDERDVAARQAETDRKAAKAKQAAETVAKAAADPEWAAAHAFEVEKASRKLAKSTEQAPTVDVAEVLKAVTPVFEEALKAAVQPLEEQLRAYGAQPAHRPMINAAGVAAADAAPVLRGQQTPAGMSPFADLEARVEKAASPQERQRLGGELLKAKAILAERARQAAGPTHGPVALFAQPPVTTD